MTLAGFPHSGIAGSKPTCGSPTLIAAYRALLRLSVPRHPPCALLSLDRIRSLAARVRDEAIPVHRTTTHVLVLYFQPRPASREPQLPSTQPITRVFNQSSRGTVSPRAI